MRSRIGWRAGLGVEIVCITGALLIHLHVIGFIDDFEAAFHFGKSRHACFEIDDCVPCPVASLIPFVHLCF